MSSPLLQWERIRSLIGRIKFDVPQSRFIMWTNGTQIGTTVDPAELRVFEDVWVSNYFNQDWKRIFADVPVKLHILDGKLDRVDEQRLYMIGGLSDLDRVSQ